MVCVLKLLYLSEFEVLLLSVLWPVEWVCADPGVLILAPPPQAVSLGKGVTSLNLRCVLGRMRKLTWIEVCLLVPAFSDAAPAHSSAASLWETRTTQPVRIQLHLGTPVLGRHPPGKVSGDPVRALTVDKGKEKARGTMSLALLLLSQMIQTAA